MSGLSCSISTARFLDQLRLVKDLAIEFRLFFGYSDRATLYLLVNGNFLKKSETLRP